MSTSFRTLALGWAACAVAAALPRPALVAQTDSTPAPPSVQAPPLSTPAPRADEPVVLLLKNGTLRHHAGAIAEEGDEYVLKSRAGSVRIRRREVAGTFGSMAEVYRYKLDRLPVGDPDEHMKLARWCISQKMNLEAAEQLKSVLAASPGNRRALDMLKNMEAGAEIAARRDADVKRAGFDPVVADAPGMMARDLIAEIRGYRGPVAKPAIFDLSDALAVKRHQEYLRSIHPVLQQSCAKCHDENSGRNFQLIRARTVKDLQNDLLVRNNLAATLGLIDRSNPGHSPLLINAILPHGPEKKPILSDPNSAPYRALWAWVESLRHGETAPGAAAPAPSGVETPMSEVFGGGFATGRAATSPPLPPLDPALNPAIAPQPPTDRQEAVHPSVPADADFQTVSPLMGGPDAAPLTINGRVVRPGKASAPAPLPALPNAAPMPGQPAADGAAGQAVTLPDGTQIITQPDGSKVMKLRDGTIATIMDKAAVEDAKRSTPEGRPEKEFKIDSNVLEQFQKKLVPPKTTGKP